MEFDTSTFQINNGKRCVRRSDVGRSQKSCLYFCLFVFFLVCLYRISNILAILYENEIVGNLIPGVSKCCVGYYIVYLLIAFGFPPGVNGL